MLFTHWTWLSERSISRTQILFVNLKRSPFIPPAPWPFIVFIPPPPLFFYLPSQRDLAPNTFSSEGPGSMGAFIFLLQPLVVLSIDSVIIENMRELTFPHNHPVMHQFHFSCISWQLRLMTSTGANKIIAIKSLGKSLDCNRKPIKTICGDGVQ